MSSASDAPVRAAGTRTRSGNAMLRTRTAILTAAAACVQRDGVRKLTMGDVATAAGVAKATLYNHFRTKPDLLAALVESRIAALGESCTEVARQRGLQAALEAAAAALAADPALRAVSADEPLALLPLLRQGQARGWELARQAVVELLVAAGTPADVLVVEGVLRWFSGQLLWPATPEQARHGAALLAGESAPARSLLGWPG